MCMYVYKFVVGCNVNGDENMHMKLEGIVMEKICLENIKNINILLIDT